MRGNHYQAGKGKNPSFLVWRMPCFNVMFSTSRGLAAILYWAFEDLSQVGEGVMALTMHSIVLCCLSSALSYAETWSGTLVDSKCYANKERNVNPPDTLTSVDRDQNQEIRYCAPSAKTKYFAVVRHDGLSFNLDSVGNAKAAELTRKISKKSRFLVVVTGEMNGHTIKVDSFSEAS